jgi:DNA-binding NarL/FixJ family response regulator
MDTHPHERLLQLLSTMLIEINALQAQVTPLPYANASIDIHATNTDTVEIEDTSTIYTGLETIEQLTRETLTIVRSILEDQSPAELEELTLPEVFSRLVEETAERLGIASRISFSGVDEQGQPYEREHRLSPRAERLLLLLIREALYGIEQRQDVHRLRLVFNYTQHEVQFNLEDDGLNSTATIPLQEDSNVAESNTPIVQPNETILSFERTEESIVRTMQLQAQQPILADLRRRFEQMGGSLVVRVLEPRGIRVQANIPYSLPAPDATVKQQTTNSRTVDPAVEQAIQSIRTDNVPSPTLTASSETIRILIVDGQAVSRAGLRHLLQSYASLNVVGEAADGVQAVSETLELGPQVVLMDTHLPEGQSLEALRQIKQLNLDTKVLLLAAQDREEYLYETLRAGANGYILKDIAPDELVQAIHSVARGEILIQPQIASRLISRYGRQSKNDKRYDTLTSRELEVLHLLARGLRNKEIAARLYVSERTVNFHLANIYQKLNVSGRTEALSKALEQGLISTP